MRIEVLVGDENPVFYNLNKPKLIVGSDMACDIIIPHSDVSRQHIIIICEEDQFAVMDRGSTNGTYLNEERLIPGRRVEFNSFFPVRLGTQVLISLVSDEESLEEQEVSKKIEIPIPKSLQAQDNSESTRVVSLKDLKQAKTETLVKKRATAKTVAATKGGKGGKAAPKGKSKKKSFKMSGAHWAALALILTAGYFNNPFKKTEVAVTAPVEEKLILDQDGGIVNTKKKGSPEGPQFFSDDIFPMAVVNNLYLQEKCSTEIEKKLCGMMKILPIAPWGVIEDHEGRLIYFINGKDLYLEAQRLFMPVEVRATYFNPGVTLPDDLKAKKEAAEAATTKISMDDYWYTSAALFFEKEFNLKAEAEFLNKQFVMVFYSDQESSKARAVVTINGSQIPRLLNATDRNRFSALDKKGIASIGFMKEFIIFHPYDKLE